MRTMKITAIVEKDNKTIFSAKLCIFLLSLKSKKMIMLLKNPIKYKKLNNKILFG